MRTASGIAPTSRLNYAGRNERGTILGGFDPDTSGHNHTQLVVGWHELFPIGITLGDVGERFFT